MAGPAISINAPQSIINPASFNYTLNPIWPIPPNSLNSTLELEPQLNPPPIQHENYNYNYNYANTNTYSNINTSPDPNPSAHRPQVSSGRERHLERNRIAANKCREKRKREHARMQTALDIEAARHKNLQAEVGVLREEIWYLKNELFVHAKCDDRFINSQLDEMASRFAHGAGDLLRCPSPSFSVSTRSDQSVVDHGTAPKTARDTERARQFYGGGLFDSFVDVPNI
ncbi:hypothetical protein N7466_002618 [Penicillium verhagenii]|uniref:uncharacterized protein n=1 Tax=Penicillium verhagenii TaxID=1562060 RepID=UPI002544D722|nr:uncharacterized protein N7466_002618 [Penicillium verhagenii]KAJ5939484.1 hypothetical protein N7466_002618 [Penicillium verhagenii]